MRNAHFMYSPSGAQQAPGNFQRRLLSLIRHVGPERALGEFRAASPLPRDTQLLFDDAVVGVGVERLTLVDDLIAEGLTRPLPNWLAVTELGYRRSGRAGHAQRTMVPKARGERQVQDQDEVIIPVFLTWDDFSFNARELAASERIGQPLDVSHVQGATRNVNEAVEDQGINGAGFTVKGNSAPGLLNAPDVNSQAYIDNEAWTAAGHSGEDIVQDVLNMVGVAQGKGFFGPYNFYMPGNYGLKVSGDFKSGTSGTTLERLQSLDFGGRPIRYRIADRLPANRTALVQMTSDVIDVVVGQTPASVSWEDGAGWEEFFLVLACMIVRPKSTVEDKSGIVLGNTT